MDPLVTTYKLQKTNADSLRHRLRFPILHGYKLPTAVDLRPWMTEIHDQGDMGSCVSNAIAGALEYLFRRYTGHIIDVSRLFIDFNARLSNINWSAQKHYVINRDDPDQKFETNRQAAIRGVQQYGFCTEELWPYDRTLYMLAPSKKAYDQAARRSIIPLRVPINITSIKTCLAHDIPVLVGIELSSSEASNNQGWIQIPKTAPNDGFHACLVVGYDDQTRHFIIRNSWGTDWGDKGYCYVPYEYLIDKRLVATADAFWAIPQIVPKAKFKKGYFNYPNFTRYHQVNMLPMTTEFNEEQYKARQQYHRKKRVLRCINNR